MSDVSSPKSAPFVFQKPNLEKTWKNLQHPFSLAVLASLGVHGVLWFGLPFMSFSSAKQPNERSLEVIELSPLEQARLPETGLSLPLQPAPDTSLKLPNSPTSNDLLKSNTSPLDDPISFYEIPGLSATSGSVTSSDIIQETQQSNFNTTKRSNTSEETRQKQQTEEQIQVQDTQEDQTTEDDTTEDNTKTQAQQESNTQSPPVSQSADDLKPGSGEDLTVGNESEKQALQQKYAYSTEGTSDQDILKNAQTASQTISEKFNIRDWEKPISASASYPKEACQFQQDGKPIQGATKFAVVVQPDGQLSNTVVLLGSSGYKGLDEAAVKFLEKEWEQIASKNKVEPGQRPKAFPLSIKFDPADADCANAPKTS